MDLIRTHATATPDKAAVIDDRGHGDVRRLTWAEFDDTATRLANVLLERGVSAGDKVAWCGQNSIGVVVLTAAARKLGVTAVPVISGGVNIYPAEIEAALELHPDIYEAAAFGIPSDEWGESVHAVVVKRPGSYLDEAGVVAHARRHLAGYKVPRSISWLDELPKTGSGKLLKRELRAPYWSGRGASV